MGLFQQLSHFVDMWAISSTNYDERGVTCRGCVYSGSRFAHLFWNSRLEKKKKELCRLWNPTCMNSSSPTGLHLACCHPLLKIAKFPNCNNCLANDLLRLVDHLAICQLAGNWRLLINYHRPPFSCCFTALRQIDLVSLNTTARHRHPLVLEASASMLNMTLCERVCLPPECHKYLVPN